MTTTITKRIRPAATFAALLAVAFGLAGCSSTSIEGTYFGSSEYTVLIMNEDQTCLYHEKSLDKIDKDKIQDYKMEDCTWTSSQGTYTIAGISKGGTVQATVNDDGSLSIPTQGTWNGEIYTKE